ncbi:magnesium transporter [Candidatus Mycoplasma haematolamae str. Purdue]|uniref:Magnesium transporter n=1 Tax=Mycoplasma haematolamae (strain Purdue) TaxID=1212765 RepID=I7BJK1_MYCHA|nr:magnesium transporter [Candidatus Mycoplasma haematolamae]AFO52038.1 magnesium transporter [Candidatus Mycoplasma haematolamae str. Purdue]
MQLQKQKENLSKNERAVSKLVSRLSRAYEIKNYAVIKEISIATPAPVLVQALEKLSNYELINIILLVLKSDRIGSFFLSFSDEHRLGILNTIRPILLSKLLGELSASEVSELLSIVGSDLSKKIFYLASPELRQELNIISTYSDSQVGSIMTTTMVTIPENLKINQALNYIKKRRHKFDVDEELFVINLNKEVVGLVNIQDLFFSGNNNQSVSEIVDKDYISLPAREQIGTAIDLFQKYPFSSAAIVNDRGQLMGVVTNKDILPEIVDENLEDVYRFYGIVNLQHSYIKATTWEVVKSRIFWLVVLLFATTLTTFIIDKFESLGVAWTTGLSSAVLVPMIPLITDMCGNSGSQTAASIIQSFASDELKTKDFWNVLKKELQISVIVGGIISLLNFFRLLVYFSIVPIDASKIKAAAKTVQSVSTLSSAQPTTSYEVVQVSSPSPVILVQASSGQNNYDNTKLGYVGAGVSSISLFLVIILSKLVGVIIPYIAHRCRKDPASLTTPLLTTLLDAVGTLIFFAIGVGVITLSMNALKTNASMAANALMPVSFSVA